MPLDLESDALPLHHSALTIYQLIAKSDTADVQDDWIWALAYALKHFDAAQVYYENHCFFLFCNVCFCINRALYKCIL